MEALNLQAINRRMIKARVSLMIRYPFFGQLLFRTQMRLEPKVEKLATEGFDIFYNPEYVNSREESALEFDLCRTVMNKIWMHPLRVNGRDLKRWNRACDYAISSFLKSCGFHLPEDALHDHKYDDTKVWGADSIYVDLIKKEPEQPPTPEGHTAGSGFGDGSPDRLLGDQNQPSDGQKQNKQPQDQASQAQHEEDMKQQMAAARNFAKEIGNCPGEIDALVDELLTPKHDWRARLREFMMRGGTDDVTWRKPKRSLFAHGFYLPTQESETMPNMGLMFDTSGSIYASKEVLQTFMSEIHAIVEDLTPQNVTVIQCDTRVTRVDEFAKGEHIDFPLKGGGGTLFSPAIDRLLECEETPEVAIYFTDLYCNDFGSDPGIPVLWAVYDNPGKVHELQKQVPFGQVIKIED